jgi:opacity protein-like surface antigen
MTLGYTAPSGRSPFKIDIQRELSTGSGAHSFNLGLSFSKVLDPVIAFGGIGVVHSLDVNGLNQARYGYTLESVEPGHSLGYSLGMGFALSYTTSITFRFQATHQARSKYTINKRTFESDGSSSASFVLGTGWRINPKTSINVSLGYGLVGLEDYNLFVSIPFDFTL